LKLDAVRRFLFRTFRVGLFLLLVLVTSVLLNYLGRYVVHSSLLSFKDIHFEGCRNVTPQELMKAVDLKVGTNIFALDLENLAQQLKTNPWVKDVTIKRAFPHRLKIKIDERIPVALAHNKRLFLVDDEGVLFKEVDAGDDIDMPIITGVSFPKPNRRSLKEVFVLLDTAEQTGALPRHMISEVHVDNPDGFIIYTLDEAMPIRITSQDYKRKLRLFARIKEDLHNRHIEPKRVDLVSPEVAHIKLASSTDRYKRR
jgi:cell division protein FtsQ